MPPTTASETTGKTGCENLQRLNPLFWLAALILLLALGDAAVNFYSLLYRPATQWAAVQSDKAPAPTGAKSTDPGAAPNNRQADTPSAPPGKSLSGSSALPGQSAKLQPPRQAVGPDQPPVPAAPAVEADDSKAIDRRTAVAEIEAGQAKDRRNTGDPLGVSPEPPVAPSYPVDPPGAAAPPVETSSPSPVPVPGSAGRPFAGLPDQTSRLHRGAYQEAADRFQEALQTVTQRFTVSLEVACQPDTLDRAFTQGDFHPALYLLPRRLGDRDCFVLLWGLYDSATAAHRDMAQLPAYFHQQTPPPRVVLMAT